MHLVVGSAGDSHLVVVNTVRVTYVAFEVESSDAMRDGDNADTLRGIHNRRETS